MFTPAKIDNATSSETLGLRDLFAAHALSALISSPKLAGVPRPSCDRY